MRRLPDGRLGSFPDDFTDEQINEVLSEQFPSQAQEDVIAEINDSQGDDFLSQTDKGLRGIAQDVRGSAVSAPGALWDMISGLPGQLQGAYEYGKQETLEGRPQNLLKQLLGIPEGIAAIYSAPLVGFRYLGDKLLAEDNPINIALKRTPTPYEFLMSEEGRAGIAPQSEGEASLRSLIQYPSAFKALPGNRMALKAATIEAGKGGDPVHGYLGGKLFDKAPEVIETTTGKAKQAWNYAKDYRDLGEKVKQAAAEDAIKRQELKQLQARYGKPEALESRRYDLRDKISALEDELSAKPIPKNEPLAIPDLTHRTLLENVENLHRDTSAAITQAHDAQAKQLGVGQDFHTRMAPLVVEGVEAQKAQVRPLYKTVDNQIKDLQVTIPNQKRAKEIEKELQKLIDEGFINPGIDNRLAQAYEFLEEATPGSPTQQITAQQALDNYKATRDMFHIAKAKTFEEGLTQEARQKWEKQAKALDPVVKNQYKLLQESFPKEVLDNLKQADEAWRKNVIPFYRNKIYRDARDQGRVPQNVIKKTSGQAPHNQIMQKLIKSNPELNRLAIGEMYSKNPERLLNHGELEASYIKAHEPTQRLMQVQRRMLEQAERTSSLLSKAQERYELMEGALNKAYEEQTQRKADSKKIEKERDKISKDLDRHAKEIQEIDQSLRILNEKIEQQGITQERLKELKRLEDRKQKIKNLTYSYLGFKGGKSLAKKIYSLLLG